MSELHSSSFKTHKNHRQNASYKIIKKKKNHHATKKKSNILRVP